MERLTRKSLEYKDTWIADGSLSNIEGVVRGNAIDRLAELEDLLEKYGVETNEELDGVLKPLIDNGELENWKSATFWKTQTERLKQENQQLKQQLAESKEENKKLVKALNGDIFINYKVPMENAKLKQQLHDLPKKIVYEISEAIERLSWRKRIYTNWEFDKEQLYKDLDTILKKYGGENE